MIERELLELSSPALGLASSIRAADAEMHHLHNKVAALEVELQGERRRHQDVVAKLEDMQEQIHRYVRSHPLSLTSLTLNKLLSMLADETRHPGESDEWSNLEVSTTEKARSTCNLHS